MKTMKMNPGIATSFAGLMASTIAGVLAPSPAMGWGSYGHQQINVAAAKIITRATPAELPPGEGLWISCLGRNAAFLQRMAVTPDVDWKIAPADRTYYYTLSTIDALKATPGDAKSLERMKKFAERELKNSFTIFKKDLLMRLQAAPGDSELHAEVERAIQDKKTQPDPAKLRADLAASYRMGVFEQPLHFFETDAFLEAVTPDASEMLSADPDYPKAVPAYLKQLVARQDFVGKVAPKKKAKNPQKPTVEELSKHGTAPWRALQLYRLGVAALKAKNASDALLYLGAMGHYVGDLSQPFHATMDFDGVNIDPHAKGLHSIFESDMYDTVAKAAGAQADKTSRLWNRFNATETEVLDRARRWMQVNGEVAGGSTNSPVMSSSGTHKRLLDGPDTEESLIRGLIFLAVESHGPIELLAHRFVDARRAVGMPDTSDDVPPGFAVTAVPGLLAGITGLDQDVSPLAYANSRLGQAAARVARLWLEAYEDAGRPALACQTFAHNPAAAIAKYPIPDYIPNALDQLEGQDGSE